MTMFANTHEAPFTVSEVQADKSNNLLAQILEQAEKDDVEFNNILSRSYRHQLGFVKIPLIDDGVNGCLRLHVWDEVSLKKEDIHSHCADFTSRVLNGLLIENLFSLKEGATHSLFRYRRNEKTQRFDISSEGVAEALKEDSRKIELGQTYERYAGQIHNVEYAAPGTITLSAWGRRRESALVLKNTGAVPDDCSMVYPISKNELGSLIKFCMSRLS